jgi:phosphoglycolate phosphatase-like HAD superfamily hydrolase
MSGGDRPLLLLWDIDGTLLQRASTEHAIALRRAVAMVHGLDDLDGLRLRLDAAGRTDASIARELLELAGVPPEAVAARAQEVRAATEAAYAELCPADLSATVAPGIPELLAELADRPEAYRFSLVTGNFEPVARLKLARAGIGHWFAPGQGAFGSDDESREALPPLARARAGDWPRERTVVIGDTPRDIACARADRLPVVAVGTGPYGIEALADADAVVDDARALAPVLADFAARAG